MGRGGISCSRAKRGIWKRTVFERRCDEFDGCEGGDIASACKWRDEKRTEERTAVLLLEHGKQVHRSDLGQSVLRSVKPQDLLIAQCGSALLRDDSSGV
jgi:hypothetical protein